MHWPDIFFKAKKPKPGPELPPTFPIKPELAKPALNEPQPPTIKPVPTTATVAPQATPVIIAAPRIAEPTPSATPTIPATHGVVLRPPTGLSGPTATPQIAPPRAVTPPKAQGPMKNIEQLMAEADPVRTLRQTGNVRILAPLTASAPETAPLPPETAAKSEPIPATAELPAAAPIAPSDPLPKLAPIEPPPVSPAPEAGKPKPSPAPMPVATMPATPAIVTPIPAPEENDSPFILKPGATTASIAKSLPPTAPALTPLGSIFRRKARMADVARIVLPPKREDSQQLHPTPAARAEPSPTIVPPAFPVAAMTARATQQLAKVISPEAKEGAAPEKIVAENKPAESTAPPSDSEDDSFILKPEPSKPAPVAAGKVDARKTELPPLGRAPDLPPQPEKGAEVKTESAPTQVTEAKPVEPLLGSSDAPKVDPEAPKPEPSAPPQPKVDPEAHKPEPRPGPPESAAKAPVSEPEPVNKLSTTPAQEKKEFHLANGERVAGVVLSETPEAVYIEHATLGVLTIPRHNIAKRLVEIILINGDRIVGDIMAETADTLYVRHASLGMLTVPRAQRSTRVVEAILKDGDRILGEVLTETDTFTVIRSATLGTITIPHTKLAMLNRKIEQVEMKSLPPPAPELKDKT